MTADELTWTPDEAEARKAYRCTICRDQQGGFETALWNSRLSAAGYPETSRLPKNYRNPPAQPTVTSSWVMGIGVALLTFGSLAASVLTSFVTRSAAGRKTDVAGDVAVQHIGERLMQDYVLPLELVALLLTAALIGAVIIAMRVEPQ